MPRAAMMPVMRRECFMVWRPSIVVVRSANECAFRASERRVSGCNVMLSLAGANEASACAERTTTMRLEKQKVGLHVLPRFVEPVVRQVGAPGDDGSCDRGVRTRV